MASIETVALGRSKRSTAGNRMRELLEKAHQEEEELFAEAEDDEEFEAPQDVRDVFLEDFADTDEEVELEEDDEEREIRREERRQAKGKTRAVYNPLATARPKQTRFVPEPVASSSTPSSPADTPLLDPSLDPSSMARTSLVLALRKQRREQKRLHRSEARRSTMRASTLRTEAEIAEREQYEKENPNRKGRRAQHESGEVRVVRKMTQDELIAAALEEEERNKEDLRAWVRREEERRELRRVGRKRVRGPRWTWISRTVGKMVEVVGDGEEVAKRSKARELPRQGPVQDPPPSTSSPGPTKSDPPVHTEVTDSTTATIESTDKIAPLLISEAAVSGRSSSATAQPVSTQIIPPVAPSSSLPFVTTNPAPQSAILATPSAAPAAGSVPDPTNNQYTRNYLILSQIPGGLAAELAIVLGDHVKWDEVQFIPGRNRPINRRPVLCPFTGLPAKYRHPATMIPYATLDGYRQIEALIANRYVWSESGFWLGGEEDVFAEGVQEVEGWNEAVGGGWLGGRRVEKRASEMVVVEPVDNSQAKRRRTSEIGLEVVGAEAIHVPKKGGKGKGKRKA